jgi:hypothetical protein
VKQQLRFKNVKIPSELSVKMMQVFNFTHLVEVTKKFAPSVALSRGKKQFMKFKQKMSKSL